MCVVCVIELVVVAFLHSSDLVQGGLETLIFRGKEKLVRNIKNSVKLMKQLFNTTGY